MADVRLIDANNLLKQCIEGDGGDEFTEGYNFAVQEISAYIKDAPAVDTIQRGKWNELKETIIEMRDNGCTASTMDVCKFLANLMEILEKEGKSDGFD